MALAGGIVAVGRFLRPAMVVDERRRLVTARRASGLLASSLVRHAGRADARAGYGREPYGGIGIGDLLITNRPSATFLATV